MQLSLLPEKEEFREEYSGKPFFLILSSSRMKKKRSEAKGNVLEITLEVERKEYLECLQANLRFLLFEKKEKDNQLKLFFLDKCETPETSAKFSTQPINGLEIEIPEETFSGKVILHLSKVMPDKVFLEVKKVTIESIIEPSFLFVSYEKSDEEELETFLLCIQ